ncbi:hypothetical protein Ga0061079_1381 [Apibacter mensalis]|uniref:Uncharacterized protein n=1 Tax=Apibacter mensalis TaxID=1586267 RepID=A0A0X3AS98_9FLAO|nr:hypothetical protein [Apibacter mensalis]CVK17266.1 hypothetical protein Ga0061079_1381 [Apibacter mensalis]
MISFNKYVVLNIDFDSSFLNKNDVILNFIFNQIGKQECFLFEMKPTKNSIIYDITSSYIETKINSKKCLYTKGINLLKEDIKNIIETDDFYLGNLIIVLNELNNEMILNLINLWDSGIYEVGVEFFRMCNDGLSFYWYNPTDPHAEDKFTVLTNM